MAVQFGPENLEHFSPEGRGRVWLEATRIPGMPSLVSFV
jgi:hypothetical protein